MLKEVVIFLGGAVLGLWFSWFAPRVVGFWRGDELDANKTFFDFKWNKTYFEKADEDVYEDEKYDGEDKRKQLENKVKVLCMVLTYPENHYRTLHIKATWGKRCKTLVFFSSAHEESIPTVVLPLAEGEDQDWVRTKESFKYVYNKYLKDNVDEIDWVLKVDDETYVVVENLRYLLASYYPNNALYFGRYMRPNRTLPDLEPETFGHMDGTAGYVLSKEAVRKLVEEGHSGNKMCPEDVIVEDDLKMGKCMEQLKVKAGISMDNFNKGRFFPMKPLDYFRLQFRNKFFNHTNDILNDERGLDCCSDSAITFHQISSSHMYTLEYFLYHLYPHGISRKRNFRPILSTEVVT